MRNLLLFLAAFLLLSAQAWAVSSYHDCGPNGVQNCAHKQQWEDMWPDLLNVEIYNIETNLPRRIAMTCQHVGGTWSWVDPTDYSKSGECTNYKINPAKACADTGGKWNTDNMDNTPKCQFPGGGKQTKGNMPFTVADDEIGFTTSASGTAQGTAPCATLANVYAELKAENGTEEDFKKLLSQNLVKAKTCDIWYALAFRRLACITVGNEWLWNAAGTDGRCVLPLNKTNHIPCCVQDAGSATDQCPACYPPTGKPDLGNGVCQVNLNAPDKVYADNADISWNGSNDCYACFLQIDGQQPGIYRVKKSDSATDHEKQNYRANYTLQCYNKGDVITASTDSKTTVTGMGSDGSTGSVNIQADNTPFGLGFKWSASGVVACVSRILTNGNKTYAEPHEDDINGGFGIKGTFVGPTGTPYNGYQAFQVSCATKGPAVVEHASTSYCKTPEEQKISCGGCGCGETCLGVKYIDSNSGCEVWTCNQMPSCPPPSCGGAGQPPC